MESMKKKKLIDNSITYGLVLVCWVVVQILAASGHMTSLMTVSYTHLDVYKRQLRVL